MILSTCFNILDERCTKYYNQTSIIPNPSMHMLTKATETILKITKTNNGKHYNIIDISAKMVKDVYSFEYHLNTYIRYDLNTTVSEDDITAVILEQFTIEFI
jgi:hypothetical protein